MHRIILALILTGLPFFVAAQKVSEFYLENGMKVLVKEDHRAPVAVSQVWYKVGASNEHSGITGVSHVLEHMMFKGTPKYPGGKFSAIVAENGGRENAFTGRDYTAYYQFVGSDRLEICFELEADRMRNLNLPPEEFKKEVEVVKEERLMRTEDNPEALTYERFSAAAYINSPYHNPVIGWMADLNSLEVDDLKDWYAKFYQPSNATLVVVGDVQPDEILALAKKYFGVIKSDQKVPASKPRQEVEPNGMRRIQVKTPAKVPYVLMGYQVPVLNNAEEKWEPYALDVLAGILDGGSSARLSRELVRGQEIASAAGAGYSLSTKYGGQFLIEANPAKGRTIAEVEKAIEAEIEKLKTELVTPDELERIKTNVIADDIYALDSVQHQANQM
ncbi:MAG TPA: insulinase family protein, partial [Thiotrichales bacterium]|nr:insulinase family protein [Thiotrichales bacterium]